MHYRRITYCCQLDNSYLLCNRLFFFSWENGIRKLDVDGLLPLLQDSMLPRACSGFRLEVISFTVKCWNNTMDMKIYFVFFFVHSQIATSSRRKRSGVDQRCKCKSLSGYEGGWQVAGTGKQQWLMYLCIRMVRSSALCWVTSPAAGLAQLLCVCHIRRI